MAESVDVGDVAEDAAAGAVGAFAVVDTADKPLGSASLKVQGWEYSSRGSQQKLKTRG